MFHLKAITTVFVKELAITTVFVKECVFEVQHSYDTIQTIPLFNQRELQAEARRHGTNYFRLGCIRIGVSALTHK